MSVIVGSDEQNKIFRRELDGREALEHEDGVHQYDFEVSCKNGDVVKLERKTLDDLRGSFDEGKLEHQCSQVDIIIVEIGPITWTDLPERVRKRLWHIEECMPTVTTTGPNDTVEYLRRLEQRGMTDVRRNRVVSTKLPTRHALLSTLYRINPEYEEEGGGSRGEVLEGIVDWEVVTAGLNLEKVAELDGLGPVTVEKIRASLVDGVEPR